MCISIIALPRTQNACSYCTIIYESHGMWNNLYTLDFFLQKQPQKININFTCIYVHVSIFVWLVHRITNNLLWCRYPVHEDNVLVLPFPIVNKYLFYWLQWYSINHIYVTCYIFYIFTPGALKVCLLNKQCRKSILPFLAAWGKIMFSSKSKKQSAKRNKSRNIITTSIWPQHV